MNKAIPESNNPASQIMLPLVSTHLYIEKEVHTRKRMKGPSDQVKENIKMLASMKKINPAQCAVSLKRYLKSSNMAPINKRFKALDAHTTPRPVSFDTIKIITGDPTGPRSLSHAWLLL
jgi:hypothetical protein